MQTFRHLILSFGQQLGASGIEADDQGYLAIQFDDQVIHVQYDEQFDEVVIFSRLGTMESHRQNELSLMLLNANLFWQGSRRATLSAEAVSGTVFLADRRTLDFLNHNTLNDWIEQFLETARYWQSWLDNSGLQQNLNAEPTLFYHDNL